MFTESEKLLYARALRLAERAHAGQLDKSGAPYITHPLRVSIAAHSPGAAIVGVLHDVLEDASADHRWAATRLLQPHYELALALLGVTRHAYGKESYKQSIRRCLHTGELAREVKLFDLQDNMSAARCTTKDLRGMAAQRYSWAYTLLVTRSEERAQAARAHAVETLKRSGRLPWEAVIS